ncbi:Charged multivesicular body protein 6-A AltName: Full=Chromatin-modifying protein 6-A [Serendipita indica DSM 11827]|uniref:Related to VPS20-Vaculolar protein sorting (Putative) n=1 Tax=Serendipita indica (strain DSM 11827) TaxID=1109443 RepID=G4TCV4_SERID|nr:Charged multivesicular body protein 6-A AltName: Full=Chromatin-modifying protein 6-A [Serendipita indica DSM 11827]CCA69147.1 related to VPS20-Vaculolar protein sorting (putative) [Serendipita indica DSM 11827]
MAASIAALFGFNSKLPKITKRDKAILDMKHQRDNLRQYQKRIQWILDQETQLAKEALRKGEKEKARRALRRKKYQESLLQQTDGQLEQLEQLVANIEFSLIEVSVMHGLKQGNEVLAQIHKEMSIESVEQLMSETREAIEYQREIDEMLSSKMTADEEDEVLKELEAIQQELAPTVALPDVPTTVPVKVGTPVKEPTPLADEEDRVAVPA